MSKKNTPSLVQRLLANPKSKKRCGTCAGGDRWLGPVRELIEVHRAGNTSVSWTDLHRALVEHEDYPFGASALQRHVRDCEGVKTR